MAVPAAGVSPEMSQIFRDATPQEGITVEGKVEMQLLKDRLKQPGADVAAGIAELARIQKERSWDNIAEQGLDSVGIPARRVKNRIDEFDLAFSVDSSVSAASKIAVDRDGILEAGHNQLAADHFAAAENFSNFEEYYNSPNFPRVYNSSYPDRATGDFVEKHKATLIEKRAKLTTDALAKGTLTVAQARANIGRIPNVEIRSALEKAINDSPQGKQEMKNQIFAPGNNVMDPNGNIVLANLQTAVNSSPLAANLSPLERAKLVQEFAGIQGARTANEAVVSATAAKISAQETTRDQSRNIATQEQAILRFERYRANLRWAVRGIIPGLLIGAVIAGGAGSLFAGTADIMPFLLLTGAAAGGTFGAEGSAYLSERFNPEAARARIRSLEATNREGLRTADINLQVAQARAQLAELRSRASGGELVAIERIFNLAKLS